MMGMYLTLMCFSLQYDIPKSTQDDIDVHAHDTAGPSLVRTSRSRPPLPPLMHSASVDVSNSRPAFAAAATATPPRRMASGTRSSAPAVTVSPTAGPPNLSAASIASLEALEARRDDGVSGPLPTLHASASTPMRGSVVDHALMDEDYRVDSKRFGCMSIPRIRRASGTPRTSVTGAASVTSSHSGIHGDVMMSSRVSVGGASQADSDAGSAVSGWSAMTSMSTASKMSMSKRIKRKLSKMFSSKNKIHGESSGGGAGPVVDSMSAEQARP